MVNVSFINTIVHILLDKNSVRNGATTASKINTFSITSSSSIPLSPPSPSLRFHLQTFNFFIKIMAIHLTLLITYFSLNAFIPSSTSKSIQFPILTP